MKIPRRTERRFQPTAREHARRALDATTIAYDADRTDEQRPRTTLWPASRPTLPASWMSISRGGENGSGIDAGDGSSGVMPTGNAAPLGSDSSTGRLPQAAVPPRLVKEAATRLKCLQAEPLGNGQPCQSGAARARLRVTRSVRGGT
jgi:hypothetical protein